MNKVKYRAGKWSTAWIIGGYPMAGERERIADELGAALLYLDTDKLDCINRFYTASAANVYINKQDYERYIDDWFCKYTPDDVL